jgi:hypothetical protein
LTMDIEHPERSEGPLGTGVPRENMDGLSLRAYFFVAPSFLFCRSERSEGSLGAYAPRNDAVGGCRPEA